MFSEYLELCAGYSLKYSEVIIGRFDSSKVTLPSDSEVRIGGLKESGIELPMKKVSGCHALFTRINGTWTVEDKDSKNGTYVNDRPLAPNCPQELQSGDIIQIGDYRLIFITAQSALVDSLANH